MDCPPEDLLGGFVSGRLEESVGAEIERHLADCSQCAAVVAAAAPDPAPARDEGRLGRYHILGVAGTGTVGIVYAAYDPNLDRKVALKVLRRTGAELEERLQREARALARVHSPHVVAVHDAGAAGERLYVTMEYIEGTTLREWLAQRRRGVGEIVEAFAQAGRGLAAAHAAGIVHRDFKPENVLVRENGKVAVTDFGLALAVADAAAAGAAPVDDDVDVQLTSTGAMVGTPAYMAPEQLDGRRADARSDLFAFSVALYAALYRHHPFPTTSLRELADAVRGGRVQPARDPAVPRRVRDVILAGLRPRPEDRPASMEEVLRRLEPRTPRWAGAALAGVALAAVAAAALVGRRPAPTERPCAGAERFLAGVWDDEQRARVRAAIAAQKSSLAASAAAGIERAFDDYAARWVAGRTDACEATRIRGQQSEAVLDRRTACLDERLMRLGALARQLERAGAEQIADAVVAAYQLPPVERCAEPQGWSESTPPSAPVRGPLLVLARASAARARAQGQLGDAAGALQTLAPSLAIAEATQDRALQAEVKLVEGQLRFEVDPRAGEQCYEAAAVAAQASGRADLAARSSIDLARLVAAHDRADDARRWSAYAAAAVERTGDDLLRARLLLARTAVTDITGGPEGALPAANEALAIVTAKLGPDHPDAAEPLERVAYLTRRARRPADALPVVRRAVALYERTLGPEHPRTLHARTEEGLILLELLRMDDAQVVLSDVLAATERVHGPEHPAVEAILRRLAIVYYNQSRFPEAAAASRRGIAILERANGPESTQLIDDLGQLASTLVRLHDPDAADAASRRAVAIAEKHLGPGDTGLRSALIDRGRMLEESDRCADAVPVLERARAAIESAGDIPELSYVFDTQGWCLNALHRYPEASAAFARALALMEKLYGPRHPRTAVVLDGMGIVHHHMGNDGSAAELEARATDILVQARQPAPFIAEARFHWAEALWSLDRRRAREQVALALGLLAPYPEENMRREIAAWRARHR